MRRFKFRAWDKVHKTMHKVGSIEFVDHIEGRTGCNVFTDDNNTISQRWLESDKSVLMQWSGVYDKNGIPIYECDIVLVDNSDELEPLGHIVTTCLNKSGCVFELKTDDGGAWTRCLHQSYRLKVVGNTFQGELIT